MSNFVSSFSLRDIEVNATNIHKNSYCFCCLSTNVLFVNITYCKHIDFLQHFVYQKSSQEHNLICYICHAMLMKIEKFKAQIERSHNILLNFDKERRLSIKSTKHLSVSDAAIHEFCEHAESVKDEYRDTKNDGNIDDIKNESQIKEEFLDDNDIFELTTEVTLEVTRDEQNDINLSKVEKSSKKTTYHKKAETHTKFLQKSFKYDGKIKVINLTIQELKQEREKELLNEMYLKLPYRCDNCIVGFDHEQYLTKHKEKQHFNGKYQCEICSSALTTEASYKEHKRRHYKRYECTACGKRVGHLMTLVKHYNEVHGKIDNTVYTCKKCEFTTESNRSFRYHMEKHKGKKECKECKKTFVNASVLQTHMMAIHKHSDRMFECKLCNKAYKSRTGLKSHVYSRHSSKGWYCVPCNTFFSTKQTYAIHMKMASKHRQLKDCQYTCDECGAAYPRKGQLVQHVSWIHLKSSKFCCTECNNKPFRHRGDLNRHIQTVHEKKEKPRNKICDYCGRGFFSMQILRTHIRTHTGERPLKCEFCSATFGHSAALYTHKKLLHSKDKKK